MFFGLAVLFALYLIFSRSVYSNIAIISTPLARETFRGNEIGKGNISFLREKHIQHITNALL